MLARWFSMDGARPLVPHPLPSARWVLIVDDQPDLIESVAAVVREADPAAIVRAARSGEDALRLLPAGPFSLLIVDFDLGGMTGVELLRHALEASPGMRAVLTSVDGEAARTAAETAGLSAHLTFLQKPYPANDLIRLVAS